LKKQYVSLELQYYGAVLCSLQMGKHGPASISKKLRILSEPNKRSITERETETEREPREPTRERRGWKSARKKLTTE
jgi:hypothetical protein